MSEEGQTPALGIIGLGSMGGNLALNASEKGFSPSVWTRSGERLSRFLSENEKHAISGSDALEGFVKTLTRPRCLIVLIKAGPAVDELGQRLMPLLEPGDVLIDGGNSMYLDTARRVSQWGERGMYYLGCGVSGGADGARSGPSLMPGGDPRAWDLSRPILEALAAKTDTGPCVAYLGPGGAGHFVKTVHNGIEYAEIQALAEAYDFLGSVTRLGTGTIARVFDGWIGGPLSSFLIDLAARLLQVADGATRRPLIEMVDDRAESKGTGAWSTKVAGEMGVAVPAISAAVSARFVSSGKTLRAEVERLLGRPSPVALSSGAGRWVRDLENALLCCRILNHAQGVHLLAAASAAHDWDLDIAEIMRIWRGGCIIRSSFIDVLRNAYSDKPDLASPLVDRTVAAQLALSESGLRQVVQAATLAGIATPVMSANLNYLDMVRRSRLPQNLVQAMRDAFGEHGYRRVDDPDGNMVTGGWQGA